MRLRRLERDLYIAQRAVGDAAAFQSGGIPRLGKRVARRVATRTAFRLLRRGFR